MFLSSLQQFVIYHAEALRILSDTDYYHIVTSDPFTLIQSALRDLIYDALKKGILTKKKQF